MSWQKKVEQREYRVVKNGAGFDNISRQSEVVWKDSKELGMARAKTPDGKSSYVVARYRPAGNFVGNFEGNVFNSKSKDPPSFIKKSDGEQESRVVERSWGSPGQSQTRVIVKETRTNTPQGTKTVKTTTTWTTSSNVETKTADPDKKYDPSREFKSLHISDAKDEGKPVIKPSKTSSPKPDKPADTSRPTQSSSTFKDQAIKMHNHYRRLHQVPNISWNNGLARDAQAWAEKIARQNTLRHATSQERNGDGENLAYFGGKFGDIAKDAIDMWYNEEKKYQYNKAGFKSGTGHFTQVVWKESEELGMGWAKSPDGRSTFIVARYRPAGNMMGSFDQNVFPPKK